MNIKKAQEFISEKLFKKNTAITFENIFEAFIFSCLIKNIDVQYKVCGNIGLLALLRSFSKIERDSYNFFMDTYDTYNYYFNKGSTIYKLSDFFKIPKVDLSLVFGHDTGIQCETELEAYILALIVFQNSGTILRVEDWYGYGENTYFLCAYSTDCIDVKTKSSSETLYKFSEIILKDKIKNKIRLINF